MGTLAGRRQRILVAVEPEKLAETITRLYRGYITVEQLARHLGTSTRTAGKVAARLVEMGFLERHSRRAYRVPSYALDAARAMRAQRSAPSM